MIKKLKAIKNFLTYEDHGISIYYIFKMAAITTLCSNILWYVGCDDACLLIPHAVALYLLLKKLNSNKIVVDGKWHYPAIKQNESRIHRVGRIDPIVYYLDKA